MAHIALVWELGSGLGHALPLRRLADQLEAQGHRVSVFARDLLKMRVAFQGSAHTVLPAPFFPGLCLPAPQMNSLADVLWYDAGGHSIASIEAQFSAWHRLFELIAPDLVIADAAPMVLAACQGRWKTLNFDGYFHATDAQAWKNFRDWERSDANASNERALRLLDHLNAVRTQFLRPVVATLHEGFAPSRQLLRCLPELDPFAPREGVGYLGHSTMAGVNPQWPDRAGKRVFVYLRRDYAAIDRLLGALARLQDCAVLCVHDGIDAARLAKCGDVHFTEAMQDLALALPQSDVVICHGGALHGLATQAGKPSLLMPLHTEHFLTARRAEQIGTSLVVMPPLTAPDYLTPIRRLLSEDRFTQAAQVIALAQRQRMADPEAELLAEIDQLLARGKAAHGVREV